MSNEESQIQEKLIEWAKETVSVYNSIAETLNKNNPTKKWGYYTQTPLTLVSQSPDLLILGINPGAEGGKDKMTGEELLKGNPCFENKDKKNDLSDKEYVIYIMKDKKDKDKNINGWALWHKIHKMLDFTGKGKLIEKLDNFVLSNMVFFGTRKESQIPKIKREECAKQTIKLISILHPKIVLLLGSQCRKLFDRVSENKLKELVPNSMYHCMTGNSHILAIKHTAYYYSSIEMDLIGKTIGYILDHQDETINSEMIRESSLKDDIIHFEEKQKKIQSLHCLKQKINAEGSNQWVDDNDNLVYEYFCANSANMFLKENGTISIGIFYKNKQCCFSVMTEGNHPEAFLKKVQETSDELKVFKMDSKDCFVADVGTDDGKIIEFFNVLLARIKDYRETDFPK